jgi:hypothetical protein
MSTNQIEIEQAREDYLQAVAFYPQPRKEYSFHSQHLGWLGGTTLRFKSEKKHGSAKNFRSTIRHRACSFPKSRASEKT